MHLGCSGNRHMCQRQLNNTSLMSPNIPLKHIPYQCFGFFSVKFCLLAFLSPRDTCSTGVPSQPALWVGWRHESRNGQLCDERELECFLTLLILVRLPVSYFPSHPSQISSRGFCLFSITLDVHANADMDWIQDLNVNKSTCVRRRRKKKHLKNGSTRG